MRTVIVFTAAAAIVMAAACNSPTGPSGAGMLNIRMTDSPYSDATALLVTISSLRAHRAEGGWQTIPFTPEGTTSRTCDLKRLENGVHDLLGSGLVPDGHYTQLRLVVSSATLYFDSVSTGQPCAATVAEPAGRTASVVIPSGEVRLNRQFTVPSSGATTILLDFDGDRSVHQTGSGTYLMDPVIAILSVE